MVVPGSGDECMDRRIAKTKKAVKNALISLLSKKDIADVTITEIAEKADINRKTFYTHYLDISSVLSEIENELCAKMFKIFDEFDFLKCRYDTYPIFRAITAEIDSDIDFYSVFVQTPSFGNLIAKLKGLFKNKIMDILENSMHIEKEILSFSVDFIAAGSLSVYEEWFKSARKTPLKEVSKIVSKLVSQGVNAIIDEDKHMP